MKINRNVQSKEQAFSHTIPPSYRIFNLMFFVLYNQNLHFYFLCSPRVEVPSPVVYSFPDLELPEAFVGTPVGKASQRVSR